MVTHKPTSVAPATMPRLRMREPNCGQLGARRRRKEALSGCFVRERSGSLERRELAAMSRSSSLIRRLPAASTPGPRHPFGAVSDAYIRLRRRDDRPIAGAAAKIARQRIVDRGARGPPRVLVQAEQRHHEAGRAETALRRMAVDERLLHRMQRAVGGPSGFDGEQALPSTVGSEPYASVDRSPCKAGRGVGSASTTVHAPQSPSAQPSLVPTSRGARAGIRAGSFAARDR